MVTGQTGVCGLTTWLGGLWQGALGEDLDGDHPIQKYRNRLSAVKQSRPAPSAGSFVTGRSAFQPPQNPPENAQNPPRVMLRERKTPQHQPQVMAIGRLHRAR